MDNKKVGNLGEDLACGYLAKNKYKILFRNHHQGFDEIDVIVKSFDGVLVFVEVKSLKNTGYNTNLVPEDNLTKTKFKKISRACRIFVGSYPRLVDKNRGWRIDLIAVTLNGPNKGPLIDHYKNISI
jgi:putative endonuclease